MSFYESLDLTNVLAGFLLGLFPIIIPPTYRAARTVKSGAFRKFRGTFYLYHWSGKNTGVIRRKVIQFGMGPTGRILAKMIKHPATGLAYRGHLSTSKSGPCYINFQGDGNEERVMLVFSNPVKATFTTTSGVFCSVTLDGTPAAWKAILSRKKMKKQEVREFLGEQFVMLRPEIQPL